MLGQQLKVEGDGNENVHLYHYINDNIQIQFGREEFCLVTGLRFGGENLTDYNDDALPIPFRRWVFLSYLDGEHITGSMVFRIINDELFDRLYDDDDVSLCCLGILQLVLLGVKGKRRIPDWMLRLANDRIPAQSATPYCQPAFPSYSGTYNWQSPILSHMGNPNLEPLIERHHDVDALFNQNILNRGKREQCLSFYKRTPYIKQPLTTVLPKQRVTFWQQLVPHLCMPDIDAHTPVGWLSEEHMNAWMELLIRFRRNNAPWTVAYTNTISVHPENQRFLIEMNQHTIGTLDGSTRPYPAWSVVNWVFLPIHVGGNHWVMGVIDLPNSHVYVFDYLHNEERNKLLSNQIQRWTPMVNNILQGRGCFNETRGPYNFQFSYNVGLERSLLVNGDPQEFWETVRNNLCQCFYLSWCEDTRDCGYD
nr:phospholipase-like protein [Tanacetum cinerariifolium]